MNRTQFFSLSDITRRIQQILQPHVGKLFWVKAEISSGRERGGSFYCNLVESDAKGKISAQMRCTIWSRDLARIRKRFKDHNLDLTLEDGTAVGFQCSLQYSPQYGLSLKVNAADPAFALGELELKKKEILDRLIKDQLLEPNKRLFVPALPLRIGLVTSKNSAACNDFIKTLKTAPFGFKIYLADALVQGLQAEASVINALETLAHLNLELVVIARGGGSKTDLFYLDNENIARKVAAYGLPVWTGIGHETDLGILDQIANRYFKTPTAVAEELVARFVEMKRHAVEATNRFKSTWAYRSGIERKYITDCKSGLSQGTRKLIEAAVIDLNRLANQLSARVGQRIADEKTRVSISKRVIASAPLNTVKQTAAHMADRKARFRVNCNRQLSVSQKELSLIKGRFRLGRFNQRIHQENLCLSGWKDRYWRRVNIEFNTLRKELEYLRSRFHLKIIAGRLGWERNALNGKYAAIRAADPVLSLKRGFAIVYRDDGTPVKSVKGIKKREILRTKVADGQIVSTVKDVKGG